MSREIYYFSGTGNSLAAARQIAHETNAGLVSIPSVMAEGNIVTGADWIGIVFPVYHGGVPLILKRFVEKWENPEGKYIFTVCTYGDSPGLAVRHLDRLVRSSGGRLAAGFALHMPYNYLTPSPVLKGFFSSFTLRDIAPEKQQELFAGARKKIADIVGYVSSRQSGEFEIRSPVTSRLTDCLNLKETLAKRVWLKIAGVHEGTELSFLESRQLMDRGFHADEKCNGCKICSKICPVNNIKIVDDRPEWQHHCDQCFACLQWCPQQAIQFGSKTRGKKRYHHPHIKLSDMLPPAPAD